MAAIAVAMSPGGDCGSAADGCAGGSSSGCVGSGELAVRSTTRWCGLWEMALVALGVPMATLLLGLLWSLLAAPAGTERAIFRAGGWLSDPEVGGDEESWSPDGGSPWGGERLDSGRPRAWGLLAPRPGLRGIAECLLLLEERPRQKREVEKKYRYI